MPIYDLDTLQQIGNAYKKNNLSLYLGAGVSVGSGLPSWERLVLSMYFSMIRGKTWGYENYIYAIAEWQLERNHEPLEITARKIANNYKDPMQFLNDLHKMLYAGLMKQNPRLDQQALIANNSTLAVITKICQGSEPGKGIESIITYNYDNLLEIALADTICQPIFGPDKPPASHSMIPVYHVHGYVPLIKNCFGEFDYHEFDQSEASGSTAEEIVFTEEQYHQIEQNPYTWSSLVQLHSLSSSVGLFVGISLSDRNIRRLLDALQKAPLQSENYIILQRPQWAVPDSDDLLNIHKKAIAYLEDESLADEFTGARKGPSWQSEISSLISSLETLDAGYQEEVLKDLGIQPIWYDEHAQVAEIIDLIWQ